MLKELFISEVRVNLIKFLIKNMKEEFHVRALVRELGVEINAVRRELDKLTSLEVCLKNPWGNKVFYRINENSPLICDLISMVYKEEGIGLKILRSISNLGDIKFISLSKEFCNGRPASTLELDLLVVGNPNTTVLESIIHKFEQEEREINYTILTEEEFTIRKRKFDTFVIKFLIQPRIMLYGNEYEISKI
ncbi:hypothetical protein EBU94_00975 [bacterium]|nr:hypothetical protein [bacterium]